MADPILPSLDQQIQAVHEQTGEDFIWHHIDTCLSCFLHDHHNRDGELLLGAFVDGKATVSDVLESLHEEFKCVAYEMGEDRAGYDHDKAEAALFRLFEETRPSANKTFDSSLEIEDEDEDQDDYVQAWFLLTWQVPDDKGGA